jgi:hypothetical protein
VVKTDIENLSSRRRFRYQRVIFPGHVFRDEVYRGWGQVLEAGRCIEGCDEILPRDPEYSEKWDFILAFKRDEAWTEGGRNVLGELGACQCSFSSALHAVRPRIRIGRVSRGARYPKTPELCLLSGQSADCTCCPSIDPLGCFCCRLDTGHAH